MTLETVWHGAIWRETEPAPVLAIPAPTLAAVVSATVARANVLAVLLDTPQTRMDLREYTGWTDMQVFSALRRLLREQRIVAVGQAPSGCGRPGWRYQRVRG